MKNLQKLGLKLTEMDAQLKGFQSLLNNQSSIASVASVLRTARTSQQKNGAWDAPYY